MPNQASGRPHLSALVPPPSLPDPNRESYLPMPFPQVHGKPGTSAFLSGSFISVRSVEPKGKRLGAGTTRARARPNADIAGLIIAGGLFRVNFFFVFMAPRELGECANMKCQARYCTYALVYGTTVRPFYRHGRTVQYLWEYGVLRTVGSRENVLIQITDFTQEDESFPHPGRITLHRDQEQYNRGLANPLMWPWVWVKTLVRPGSPREKGKVPGPQRSYRGSDLYMMLRSHVCLSLSCAGNREPPWAACLLSEVQSALVNASFTQLILFQPNPTPVCPFWLVEALGIDQSCHPSSVATPWAWSMTQGPVDNFPSFDHTYSPYCVWFWDGVALLAGVQLSNPPGDVAPTQPVGQYHTVRSRYIA